MTKSILIILFLFTSQLVNAQQGKVVTQEPNNHLVSINGYYDSISVSKIKSAKSLSVKEPYKIVKVSYYMLNCFLSGPKTINCGTFSKDLLEQIAMLRPGAIISIDEIVIQDKTGKLIQVASLTYKIIQ